MSPRSADVEGRRFPSPVGSLDVRFRIAGRKELMARRANTLYLKLRFDASDAKDRWPCLNRSGRQNTLLSFTATVSGTSLSGARVY